MKIDQPSTPNELCGIFDGVRIGYPDKCAHELFALQATRTPETIALRYKSESITYAELNARADQIANYLYRRRIEIESLVGLYIPGSIDAITAMLGILKAGGSYVALDPSNPRDRLMSIVEDARLSLVLTVSEFKSKFPQPGIEIVCIENNSLLAEPSIPCYQSIVRPENLAYVTYTSGSTGTPKGVLAVHRSITNGLNYLPFERSGDEICCLNSPLSFGFSVSRIFLPLMTGTPLVIIPEEESRQPESFVRIIERERVTNVALITDFLREILSAGSRLTSGLANVRRIVLSGSQLTEDLVAKTFTALPDVTLVNGYASSEIGGAAFVWMRSAKDIIPNGQPCPNTRIYLLDTDLTVVGPEATGEIYVSAPHLSPGYLHEPRKTADRFLSNSFEDGLSARLYRTGDLARFSANGQIELLGRVDDVVKIRGFRVELGEIESVLLSNHEVIEAAVKAWRSSGDTRLVAYIVTKNEFISTERNLRSELTRRLPEYMLPCGYMFLRSLPKTVTGKTDRSALPPLDIVRPSISTEYAAPRTKWEASIAVIWAEVLGIDCVGIYDNFFELGGHSLLAVQVAMRIEQSFSLELPAEWFFLHPTVADLSEAVIEHDNGEG